MDMTKDFASSRELRIAFTFCAMRELVGGKMSEVRMWVSCLTRALAILSPIGGKSGVRVGNVSSRYSRMARDCVNTILSSSFSLPWSSEVVITRVGIEALGLSDW